MQRSVCIPLVVAAFVGIASPRPAAAQVSGAAGGALQRGFVPRSRLSRDDAGAFIAIEGSCELRVKPDGLRVIFAITTEAATPGDCWKSQRERREAFVAALAANGLSGESVQVDFIHLLPTFGWKQEQHDGQSVLVERLEGHRLQENVHVAVADEAAARRVIELALDHGVHDVLAVEYWSKLLSEKRRAALDSALQEAQSKSKLLLAPFGPQPPLVNVDEHTEVLEPEALYRSFENVYAGNVEVNWRENIPRIQAVRPKNTFYAGFEGDVDRRTTTPAMQPEISVVSTVVLYFESPARVHAPAAATAPEGGKR